MRRILSVAISLIVLASCSSENETSMVKVGFARRADITGTNYLAISDIPVRSSAIEQDQMVLRLQGTGEIIPLRFDFTFSSNGELSAQDSLDLRSIINESTIQANELTWLGDKYIKMSEVRFVLPCGHELYDWCEHTDELSSLVRSAVMDMAQFVKRIMLLRVSDGALFDIEGIYLYNAKTNYDGKYVYAQKYNFENPEQSMIVRLSDASDKLLISEIASYSSGNGFYLDRNDNLLIIDDHGQYIIRFAAGGIDEFPLPEGDNVYVYEYKNNWYSAVLSKDSSTKQNTVEVYAYAISGKSVSYNKIGSYTSTIRDPMRCSVQASFAIDENKYKVRLTEVIDNYGNGGKYVYTHLVVDPLAQTVTQVPVPEAIETIDQRVGTYVWNYTGVHCTLDAETGLIKRYTYGPLTIEEISVDMSKLPELQITEDDIYNHEMDSFVMSGVEGESVFIDAKTGEVTVVPADENVSMLSMRRIN